MEKVKAARKEDIYERAPRSSCQERGFKPLQLKWLDVNKGDSQDVKVRSRLVIKEVKKAKRPEEQLRAECVQLLLSLFMTKRPGMKKRKLGVWDISRAH